MALTSDMMCVTSEYRETAVKILYWHDLQVKIAMLDGGKITENVMGSTEYPVNSVSYIPLVSWVKRDQLDVTCFIISLFNAQHVSDVNTSILRSLRLICW